MPSNPATHSLYVLGFATVPFRDRITKRVCGDQDIEIAKQVCGYQDTESKLTFHRENGCLWVSAFEARPSLWVLVYI